VATPLFSQNIKKGHNPELTYMGGGHKNQENKTPSVVCRPTKLTISSNLLIASAATTHTQLAANITRLPKLTKLLPRKTPKRLSPHLELGQPPTPNVRVVCALPGSHPPLGKNPSSLNFLRF